MAIEKRRVSQLASKVGRQVRTRSISATARLTGSTSEVASAVSWYSRPARTSNSSLNISLNRRKSLLIAGWVTPNHSPAWVTLRVCSSACSERNRFRSKRRKPLMCHASTSRSAGPTAGSTWGARAVSGSIRERYGGITTGDSTAAGRSPSLPVGGKRMFERHTASSLTRRAALRMFASAAGIALLAACQAPTPASAPTAGPAPKPTTAPQPTQATGGGAPAAATSSAVASDRAAQAGFIPVGVGPSSASALTPPKGQPRNGGTLRIGNLGDLPNADGHWISGQNVFYAVYDRLVDLDASLQPHPSLAESWDTSADFSQITFHLRKGVMLHSGRELAAEDIAWNYNRIKGDNKIDGGIKANFFVPLDSVETPDKYTVVLKAKQPWPAVFNVLAWTNILDPTVPPEQNKPSGTGPFTFVEWVQGDHFTLQKNPNYWQSGKQY